MKAFPFVEVYLRILLLAMPTFGFGRKGQHLSFMTDVTNKKDVEEIKEIADAAGINTKVY